MTITITVNGDHRLDQTAGVQNAGAPDKDDYALDSNLAQLPDAFEGFLEGLAPALTATQLNNAATYELGHEADAPNQTAATSPFFVTVAANGGETLANLALTRSDGSLFNGQVATYNGVNITIIGSNAPIYLYSFAGGDVLIGSTEAPADVDIADPTTVDGSKVAFAYYLQENGAHTGADLWGVAFQPFAHPTAGDGTGGSHDEPIDMGDFLNVSAQASLSFSFDTLKSGKFLWVAVGDDANGLLATGKDLNVVDEGSQPPNKVATEGARVSGGNDPSDAMNTSQGGQGATIGVNNQMFVPGSAAVLTLVKGFAQLDADGPDATGDNVQQIDYDDYINTTSGGIFISQTQGNDLINMTVKTYEAGGAATDNATADLLPEESFDYIGAEGGNNGTSAAFEDDHPVPIASVEVRNAANVVVGTWVDGTASDGTIQGGTIKVTITGNVIDVDGLPGGYTVNWTTAGGETFNRVQVQADAGSESFDIGRFDASQVQVVPQQIGDSVLIHDDGPAMSQSILGGAVAFATGSSGTLTQSHGGAPGTDGGSGGAGGVTIYGYTDLAGFTETLSLSNTRLVYTDDNTGEDLYQLDVTATDYTFTVLQDAPPAFVDLDFAAIPSSSPQETLTVPAVEGDESVTFDGVNFSGTAPLGETGLFGGVSNAGAGSTADDLNPDAVGFGEKGGQASQMNQNEGFLAFVPGSDIQGLKFDIQGIGSIKSVDVEWWVVDDGAVVDYEFNNNIPLLGGQSVYTQEIVSDAPGDLIYVRFFYDTKPDTAGVRVENFALFSPNEIPDRTLQFQFQITDGDLDTALSNQFSVHVDPELF